MEQIRIDTYNKIPSNEEFIRWANDAAALVNRYNWGDEKVRPWSYPITVASIIEDVYGAPLCTYGSKVELYLLAKGLTKILNAWEDKEINGVTLLRKDTGKVFKVDREDVEFFLETGKFEVVE